MIYFDDNLNLAHMLARKMHYGMTYRNDNDPNSYYNNHIVPVGVMVMYYTTDNNVRIAAILHDIIEDTPLNYKMVDTIFGKEIASLVWKVTDEPGKNRKEKKAATYPKIVGCKEATLIKLCDRYINTKDSKTRFMDMYRNEYPEFNQKLFIPGMWDELWKKLDKVTLTGKD